MNRMQHITRKWIYEYKDQFIKMSNITEFDIQKMWIHSGEEELTEFSEIENDLKTGAYKNMRPLYQKMIFRFLIASRSPSRLAKQIDPVNRQRFLEYFNIYDYRGDELIEFMAWIINGLGSYDIINLIQFTGKYDDIALEALLNFPDNLEETAEYKLWKTNEIVFFFGMNEKIQNVLIDQYNKNCVDTYNKMISDKHDTY